MSMISPNPKGTDLSRYLRALALSKGRMAEACDIARQWPDSPGVRLTLEKTAVTAQSTADGLAEYGLAREFYELYRSASVVGRLSDQMRATPFRTKVPKELDSGVVAAWIPEATLKPVRAFSFDTLQLEEFKIGCMVVISNELAKMSTPSAEATIRQILTNAVASFIDSEFLSSNAAVVGESPAGIGNGQQTHTSTGSTAAQIAADLSSMAGKLGSWASPVWICRPRTLLTLGALDIAKFLPGGPLLCGFPVATTVSSPAQIILLDLGAVLFADEGQSSISLSRQATVTMGDGGSPEVEEVVSLWQKNLACLRVERFISWLATHDAAVVVMTVSY